MSDDTNITCRMGWQVAQQATAARLYDQAFAQKFRLAIRSRQDRLALYQTAFCSDCAPSASNGTKLVGLLGFYTAEGSLTGGIDARLLLRQLGLLRGVWALMIFAFYHRKPVPGQLLMDGIAVDQRYRGRGIGSQLLQRLTDYARQHGDRTIRLDVVDTNPDARRLYQREGFVAVRVESFACLRWLFGFGGCTTMEKVVTGVPDES